MCLENLQSFLGKVPTRTQFKKGPSSRPGRKGPDETLQNLGRGRQGKILDEADFPFALQGFSLHGSFYIFGRDKAVLLLEKGGRGGLFVVLLPEFYLSLDIRLDKGRKDIGRPCKKPGPKRFQGFVCSNFLFKLRNNGSMVHLFIDFDDGCSGFTLAGSYGGLNGGSPSIFGEGGGVNS